MDKGTILFSGDGMTPAEKNSAHQQTLETNAELLLHLSKISRLEGQVQALVEAAGKHARRISKIEEKQRKLDGLRSHLS